MIENFGYFLFNSILESTEGGVSILYSDRLRKLLHGINDYVSDKLLVAEKNIEYKTKRMFIDYVDNDLTRLSFIMMNKLDDISKNSTDVIRRYPYFDDTHLFDKISDSKLKGTIGFNQFVNEIFGDEFKTVKLSEEEKNQNKELGIKTKPQQLEEFINKLKSLMSPGQFEIVKGDNITYWYNEENYSFKEGGSLSKSCMRYYECMEHINFYAINPTKVSLLIMKDREDNTKIIGRAIIWELTSPNRTFMDRIYCNIESDIELFKQYAKENGWLYKYKQNMYNDEYIVDSKNDTKSKLTLIVDDFKNKGDNSYPYLDTLKYYAESNGIGTLSNNIYSLDKNKNLYKLESIDGDAEGGYSVTEMRKKLITKFSRDLQSFVTNSEKFWDYIDGEKFIENYRVKEKELMLNKFETIFDNHFKLTQCIININSDYEDLIKDKNLEQLYDFIDEQHIKEKIVENYINVRLEGRTPREVFYYLMRKKPQSLLEVEFNNIILKYLDVNEFMNDAVNEIPIENLFDYSYE